MVGISVNFKAEPPFPNVSSAHYKSEFNGCTDRTSEGRNNHTEGNFKARKSQAVVVEADNGFMRPLIWALCLALLSLRINGRPGYVITVMYGKMPLSGMGASQHRMVGQTLGWWVGPGL